MIILSFLKSQATRIYRFRVLWKTMDIGMRKADLPLMPYCSSKARHGYVCTLQHVKLKIKPKLRHVSSEYYSITALSMKVYMDDPSKISCKARSSLSVYPSFHIDWRRADTPLLRAAESAVLMPVDLRSRKRESISQRGASKARYLHDNLFDIHMRLCNLEDNFPNGHILIIPRYLKNVLIQFCTQLKSEWYPTLSNQGTVYVVLAMRGIHLSCVPTRPRQILHVAPLYFLVLH